MSGLINKLFDEIPGGGEQQTKALRRVADAARDLWKKNTEPGSAAADLDLLARRVGDVAREESNRIPLGESGLLEFFCSVVSSAAQGGARPTLVVQCLRIIGNSSADTDENRARVVASGCLPSIVALLNNDDDDSLLAFVIPVLFNISVDYEPAQKAIYQAGINPELVRLISGPRLEDAAPLLDYICKLLGFVAAQEPEANLVHPATPFVLLSLADEEPSPVDAKEFLGQTSVALTYLSQEQFQPSFLETPDSIGLILRTFSMACGDLDASLEGPDDAAQLKQVQTAFTATLADLSAHPLFATSCSLDGPEVATLQQWISAAHIPLQSAACLALGNIARSDEKCSYLVQQRGIHAPLVSILKDQSNVDAGLLHSVLGFLKNLAIPAANKPVLGDAGLFEKEALPRIWELDAQTQVQFDAVSLTRLLLVNCPANVHRIISHDDGSSAQSKLQSLIDLGARSDQEPTQMETARAIATACRVLHSSPPTPSAHPDLPTFHTTHQALTDAMLRLGQQSKYPVLRSELLFALALMARTEAGAAAISQTTSQENLLAFVAEVITGERNTAIPATEEQETETETEHALIQALEPQAPKTTAPSVDRENALVLVAELLRPCPDALPAGARGRLEDLLRNGTERVLRERGSGSSGY
ncbi:armadillo-type protein [Xylaria telfairii]|nr:armadillo-type protein [Xylaria telfairii]